MHGKEVALCFFYAKKGFVNRIVIELDRNFYKSEKSLVKDLMKIVEEQYSEIDFVAVNIEPLE
jgi:hypothetical protein